MNCPKCNGQTSVIDSDRTEISVKRRRKCLGCSYRFNTLELEEDALSAEYEKNYAVVLDYLVSVIEGEKRKLKKG